MAQAGFAGRGPDDIEGLSAAPDRQYHSAPRRRILREEVKRVQEVVRGWKVSRS